jgi:hypothetical protein
MRRASDAIRCDLSREDGMRGNEVQSTRVSKKRHLCFARSKETERRHASEARRGDMLARRGEARRGEATATATAMAMSNGGGGGL